LADVEGDTGFAAEGGRVRGTGAVPQRLLPVKRLLRGKDGRLGERRVLSDRRQRSGDGFEVLDAAEAARAFRDPRAHAVGQLLDAETRQGRPDDPALLDFGDGNVGDV